MLVTIVIVLGVLVAGILIFAATRPPSFRVERGATVNATAQTLFPLINDFHNWPSWSPWEKLDPAMKKSISGAANGKGSVYEWEGNSKAGKGRMEIADSVEPRKVNIKLDFEKPFKSSNVTEFTLVPEGNATNVTWTMDGPSPFMMRVMGLFMNMDKMVGKDFEAGLASIKAIAEKRA
jgi:Polyketide cyclase / dehydrase and lipid transport